MSWGNKKIVDERQERQSMKNSGKLFTMMIMMLCIWMIVQSWFLQWGFAYIMPEFITLMAGCIGKIVLDARQGIVYTEMNSKVGLTVILYVSAALIFSIVLGIRNYLLYGFELWKIALVIIPVAVGMLILFASAHFAYLKMSKRRLAKLERELDREELDSDR